MNKISLIFTVLIFTFTVSAQTATIIKSPTELKKRKDSKYF